MAGYGGKLFTQQHVWWIWGPWAATIAGALFGAFMYDLLIFTGGESPVNYPPRRRKRALLIKEMKFRNSLRWRQQRNPRTEAAVHDIESQ